MAQRVEASFRSFEQSV